MINVIGNLITAKIRAQESNYTNWDMMTKGETVEGEAIVFDTGESISKQELKTLDLLTEVVKYYITFDARFKETLKTIDYYSKSFVVGQKVTYGGNAASAGVSVLFKYTGAGDPAVGLVPVAVKAYPTHILGQFLSQRELLNSITNLDTMELVAALTRNAPEVVFFLKVLALFNTANSQYSDIDKRIQFLNDELRLIYIRLMRTIDFASTTYLNAFEPDETRWETIYIKTPGQCFKNAPQIIRDFVAEIEVDVIPEQSGGESRLSFEEYLINQFEIFDKLRKIKFDGDVDYVLPSDKFSEKGVEDYLFALFIRVLNEVSQLEEYFAIDTDPVEFIDKEGVSKTLVGKNLFEQTISGKLKAFRSSQNKLIDAAMDFAGDPMSQELEDALRAAEDDLSEASEEIEKVTLEFRKYMSLYPYERTLGYKPERILDVMMRECKRAYQNAKNQRAFTGIFSKVYGLFAKSFPISEKDLLEYAQNSEPIKPPIKILGAGITE
jgi:hypothetical protein